MDDEEWILARRIPRNEQEWFVCRHPHLLSRILKDKASDRKAPVRKYVPTSLLDWPEVKNSSWTIDVLERQADEDVPAEELRSALVAIRQARENTTWVMGGYWNQGFDEMQDSATDALAVAGLTCEAMSIAVGRLMLLAKGVTNERPKNEDRVTEMKAQCDVIRDIFGNLFRPPSPINPSLRTSNIRQLALASYNERNLPAGTLDPALLSVLADALEEAGCHDAELLGHLRCEGPHVRGCWALDVILGKA